jgi:putative ABC transport system substrate-binding protein
MSLPGLAHRVGKRATASVPIAFVGQADPVGSGLVDSFNRPGGNITGVSSFAPALSGKPLQLLQNVVPTITRVAILWHAGNPSAQGPRASAQQAAGSLGLAAVEAGVRDPSELDEAFRHAERDGADAVLVIGAAIFGPYRDHIGDLALQHGLPSAGTDRGAARTGLLLGYGPNFPALYRLSARQVDKILKGARPADLPVEQPVQYDLAINFKTARMLGLAIPDAVRAQVTESYE